MALPTELLRQLSWLGRITHTEQDRALSVLELAPQTEIYQPPPSLSLSVQVFQYDGSVKCTSPEFAVFALIGLLLVILFVTPAPFAVGYICFRRPQVYIVSLKTLSKLL